MPCTNVSVFVPVLKASCVTANVATTTTHCHYMYYCHNNGTHNVSPTAWQTWTCTSRAGSLTVT